MGAYIFLNRQKCSLDFCVLILLYSKPKLKKFVSSRTGLKIYCCCIARWQYSHCFEKKQGYSKDFQKNLSAP